MKRNKVFIILLVTAFMIMAACGKKTDSDAKLEEDRLKNLNKTDMPIVDEKIDIDFFVGKFTGTADDWNDVLIWEKFEEMSNIHINWELVPREGLNEKRNLALANEDLPDVFYTAYMPTGDLLKYGKQGSFLKLNDLIEEYMPNLTALMEEYPSIRKGITFPDGNIYSLPTIYSPDFPSVLIGTKLWIREDWLEALEMDIPETTEEFYQYLKAVKEQDPGNNNGIPFGDNTIAELRGWLNGAFGIGNKGSKHHFLDTDPDTDELRFFPASDGYRELLEYLNKLYEEELINENIYTIETSDFYAQGSEGLYGATVKTGTESIFGEMGKNYVGVPALEGPNGDRKLTKIGPPLAHLGGFVITSSNEHPEATLRWMDYFYSDEGSKMFFMGEEGTTFEEKENGEIDYVDEILNSPDGLTFEQELKKYVTYMGGGYPGIVKQEFFKGAESKPESIEVAEMLEPFLIDEVWPHFTYTEEEQKILDSVGSDIHKFVNEMQDKFITGNESLDNWDKYIESIESQGLEEYMEVQQAAYERYLEN